MDYGRNVKDDEYNLYHFRLAVLATGPNISTCAIGLCGCVNHDSEFNSMKVNPIINFAIA